MSGHAENKVMAWRTILAAALLVPALSVLAERQPYERYRSIVDRQMFGPLPVGFDPTKSPTEVSRGSSAAEKELTKEQEKVKSAIRFSVINVTPEGETAIGFTDNSDPKKPVHYYLKVGESKGGWEVREADAKAATMTVAKDGVEVSLSLGGDSANGADKSDSATAKRATPGQARSALLSSGASLASRRRARLELEEADRREAAEREARREAEEKARAEERAQREAEEQARREADREENRKQLEQIRDELRKAREASQSRRNNDSEGSQNGDSSASDGG